jgi:hypothetical protein
MAVKQLLKRALVATSCILKQRREKRYAKRWVLVDEITLAQAKDSLKVTLAIKGLDEHNTKYYREKYLGGGLFSRRVYPGLFSMNSGECMETEYVKVNGIKYSYSFFVKDPSYEIRREVVWDYLLDKVKSPEGVEAIHYKNWDRKDPGKAKYFKPSKAVSEIPLAQIKERRFDLIDRAVQIAAAQIKDNPQEFTV